jgi:hypothetical protein
VFRTVLVGAVAAAATGCCGDDVRTVDVAFGPEGVVWPSYAWLGDTITLYASADRATNLVCPPELYNSISAPERFRYSSTDTTVATVTSRGLLAARALGVTRVVAISAGISSDLPVIVSPPFASLHITVTPATGRVGDTITVRADALDSNGAAVPGGQVGGFALLRPSDTLATWLPNGRPSPPVPYRTFPAPIVDRLVLQHPGVVKILVAAPHDAGRPLRYVIDSVIVSITPR